MKRAGRRLIAIAALILVLALAVLEAIAAVPCALAEDARALAVPPWRPHLHQADDAVAARSAER